VCIDAMGVEWDEVQAEAAALGILYVRLPVFDFDRIDQVLRLSGGSQRHPASS
jgi:hypothetical protein